MNDDVNGRVCECGRWLEPECGRFCRRCEALPKGAGGLPEWRRCMNCGKPVNGGGHGHFVPPGGGDPGFFSCSPAGECKTCGGEGWIDSSTSGRAFYGAAERIRCPTCTKPEDKPETKVSPELASLLASVPKLTHRDLEELGKAVKEALGGEGKEPPWKCVWCGKPNGTKEGCCSPDGDGHLFRRE